MRPALTKRDIFLSARLKRLTNPIEADKITLEETCLLYTSDAADDLIGDGNTCSVLTSIDEQSPDIALGVDKSLESKEGFGGEAELGAGDQGMMVG